MNAGGRPADPVRAVFLGSGAFAVPILDVLVANPAVDVVGVVSAPDRPAGRGAPLRATPVAARARELDLALLQPARIRDDAAIAEIAALRPALGVLADYGRIVPPAVLELPRHGILNVHPSLLPRHRGASPIPATILAGDRETGVTLIRMDAGLDTGPIVAATRWPLDGTEAAPELEDQAARAGAELVDRSVANWLAGTLPARPQDDSAATLSRPLRREDGRLDPGRPAVELERQVRAYQPWPGSHLESSAGRLTVWRASVRPSEPIDAPGQIVVAGGVPALATVDGRLILDELQPDGGRRMAGAEFLRGRGRALAPPANA